MAFTIPDKQKLDLHAALVAEGWNIEQIEPAPNAGWMNELWRIRSRWRPVGATLFVSFCGDPQDERDPPERVGTIGIGSAPARYFYDHDLVEFVISPGWPRQLPEILQAAARLRDAAPESAP